jgi:hypothetical protein
LLLGFIVRMVEGMLGRTDSLSKPPARIPRPLARGFHFGYALRDSTDWLRYVSIAQIPPHLALGIGPSCARLAIG